MDVIHTEVHVSTPVTPGPNTSHPPKHSRNLWVKSLCRHVTTLSQAGLSVKASTVPNVVIRFRCQECSNERNTMATDSASPQEAAGLGGLEYVRIISSAVKLTL